MSDLKIQGVVEVSTEGAENALKRVGTTAEQMAGKASQSADKAGKAVEGIGVSSERTTRKIEREYSSIARSIELATAKARAALEGTGRAGEIANRAIAKGLDPSRINEMVSGLASIEAQAAKSSAVANRSLNTMGVSAAQTAAALRGVPAQFTDIMVSLQGGQAPLTVFLQQGGQLKDMFGGAGNAAKALSGYVIGLVNPLSVAAASVAALAVAYNQGANESQAFAKAMILSGNAAGTSADGLARIATGVSLATGATQGAIAGALAQIVQSGKVSESVLAGVASAAVSMASATGRSIEDLVKEFAELGNEPVKASLKLNEQYKYLTSAVYEQIKALEDQGRTTEAANLAQKAYADTMQARAAQIKENLGAVESAWFSLGKVAKTAWDQMLGIGRKESAEDKLSALQDQLAFAYNSGATESDATIVSLNKQIAAAENLVAARRAEAKATGETTAAEQAKIRWAQEGEKYLSKQMLMQREIAKIEQDGIAAGASRVEIERRISEVRSKYVDKGAISAAKKELSDLDKLLDSINGKDSGFESNYVKNVETMLAAYGKGKLTLGEFNDVFARYVAMQPGAVAAAKELAKAKEDAAKAESEYHKALSIGSDALEQQAANLEREVEFYGMSESAIQSVILARMEEARAIAAANGAYPEHLAYLDREINARKRIAAAAGSKDALDTNKRSIEQNAKAWEKFYDDIERSLTDSLYRSFEAGESFGDAFVNSLQNTLKTTVLKVAVQGVMDLGKNALGSLISSAGGADGSGGGGGWAGAAQNAYSAYNGLGNIANAFGGTGSGAVVGSTQIANGVGSLGGDSLGTFIDLNASNWGTTAGNSFTSTVGTGLSYAGAGLSAYGAGQYLGQKYGTAAGAIGGTAVGAGSVAIGGAVSGAVAGTGAMAGSSAALAAIPVWGWAAMAALAIFGASGKKPKLPTLELYNNQESDATTYGTKHNVPAIDTPFGALAYSGKHLKEGKIDINQLMEERLKPIAALDSAMASVMTADQYTSARSRMENWSAMEISKGKSVIDPLEQRLFDIVAPIDGWIGSLLDTVSGTVDAKYAQAISALAAQGYESGEEIANQLLGGITAGMDEGETLAGAFGRIAGALGQVNPLFEDLGLKLYEISTIGGDAASDLITLYGGLESLQGKFASYYENYYTAEEKRANVVKSITEALSAAGADINESDVANATREQFRAAYESIVATSGAASPLAVAMLRVESAFASITPTLEEAADAADAASEAQRKAAEAQREAAEVALLNARDAYDQSVFGRVSASDSLDGIKGAATSNYLSALDNVASAQERIASIQISAQIEVARAAQSAADNMKDLAKSLRDFVSENSGTAESRFSDVLKAAMGGDAEAMRKLPSAAQDAYKSAELTSATALDYELTKGWINAQVASVASIAEQAGNVSIAMPAQPSEEALALSDLAKAQSELSEALRVATTIGASLTRTPDDLIAEYGKAQVELTKALAAEAAALKLLTDIESNTAHLIDLDYLFGELGKSFDGLDANFDGLLTFDELREGLSPLATDSMIQTLIDAVDLNGDGQISKLEEVISASSSDATKMASALSSISIDSLTYEEAKAALAPLWPNGDIDKALKSIDVDGNGIITQQEISNTKLAGLATGILGLLESGSISATDASAALVSAGTPTETVASTGGTEVAYVSGGGAVATGSTTNTGAAVVYGINGVSMTIDQIKAWVQGRYDYGVASQDFYGAVKSIRDGAVSGGISSTMLDGIMGWASGSALQAAYNVGLPAFAKGTSYVPEDMTANIHKGEIIIDPASSNILRKYGIGVQGSNNSRLESEVRQLREENQAQSRAFAALQLRMVKLMERWDTSGMPEERVVA